MMTLALFHFGCTGLFAFAQHSPDTKAVAAQSIAVLGPENSRVEFIGTHVGDDPKPRLGGFKSFRGLVVVDPSTTKLQSLELSFEIGSIWTEFDNLTNHLMQADFFDQAKFPQATFRSSEIETLTDGSCNIKGELNMHGQTVEIGFPASFELSNPGLTLKSEFTLDRTQFGMDRLTDGVEKEVSIKFTIGVPDRNRLDDKVTADQASPQPVALRNSFLLSPKNSSVEFIGTHVGNDPKPRLGGFSNFRGILLMDESGQNLESLSLDFEVGSIWTEFDNLTRHLLTADFFDRDKFPTANFRSTQIVPNGDQQYTVKGNLTMMDTTAELSFPISVKLNEAGVEGNSEFTFDRTQFGMTKMTEGVEPLVTVRFTVGKPDRHAK